MHGALFEILAVVLIHDLRVRLYMPRENTVFEGTLEAREASIPGLDLTLDDVHAAVTGTIVPGRYPGLPIADYRLDGNTAAVTLGGDSGRRTLWIDTGRMTVTRVESESSRDGVPSPGPSNALETGTSLEAGPRPHHPGRPRCGDVRIDLPDPVGQPRVAAVGHWGASS